MHIHSFTRKFHLSMCTFLRLKKFGEHHDTTTSKKTWRVVVTITPLTHLLHSFTTYDPNHYTVHSQVTRLDFLERWHPQLHDMHRHIMCSRCHMSVNLGVRNSTELLKWIMTKVATEASNSCGTQWLLYHVATIKMWGNNVVKLYSNYSWWFEAVWNILDCQLASFLQVGAQITTLWR